MAYDNNSNGSVYFKGFTREQKDKIKREFKVSYGCQNFDIRSIGDMPYGCLIAFKDCSRGTYCVDIFNETGKISVRVRPEGDFPNTLERALERFFNINKKELSL